MDIQINGVAKIGPQFRSPVQQVVAVGESAARPTSDPAAARQATTAESAAVSTESTSATAATGDSASSSAAAKLRFPWLSRISTELEPVAKQKPPFKSLPITGDNLDHAA